MTQEKVIDGYKLVNLIRDIDMMLEESTQTSFQFLAMCSNMRFAPEILDDAAAKAKESLKEQKAKLEKQLEEL